MKKNGFTVVEMILTVALTIIIFSIGGFALSNILNDTQLASNTRDLLQTLRTAQTNSTTRYRDSSWGVYFDAANRRYTLFAGSTYASRQISLDRVATLANNISLANITIVAGGTEIVFTKGTGTTTQTGTLDIIDAANNGARLNVNTAGHISFETL